jgi:hypothetical protein
MVATTRALWCCACSPPLMGWPGRAQRSKTTVEQDGQASKLKELRMHTHQKDLLWCQLGWQSSAREPGATTGQVAPYVMAS